MKLETNTVSITKAAEMKNLIYEVRKIEHKNIKNEKVLKACEALYIRMVTTLGHLNKELETLEDEMRVGPLDIPEKEVKAYEMSWKEV